MTKQYRFISLLVVLMLLIGVLSGCTKNEQPAKTSVEASTAAEVTPADNTLASEQTPSAEAETRIYPYTFTDLAGVEVTLEKDVETVYIVGSVQPLLGIYRYARGNSDGLLTCPEASQNIIKSSVMSEIWPDILNVAPHGDSANVEEILALDPDVVFMTGNGSGDTYDALKNAGLTIVNFPTAASGDANDTFEAVKGWLEQMAEVFDAPESAAALIKHNDAVLAEITEKTAAVSEEDKPNALIVFQLTDNSLKVAGSGHYSEFWLSKTGAKNAAAEIEKLQEVDIEQLMAWDPDIIYLTTFSPAMPEDLYNNTIEGFDFSQLSAVKNKQVYKIPLGSYRWYAPSCECSLMLKWMASINHPELFSDMSIESEVKDFMTEFYGKTPTDEQVQVLLNPSDASLMSH